jgi:hypothetical protein
MHIIVLWMWICCDDAWCLLECCLLILLDFVAILFRIPTLSLFPSTVSQLLLLNCLSCLPLILSIYRLYLSSSFLSVYSPSKGVELYELCVARGRLWSVQATVSEVVTLPLRTACNSASFSDTVCLHPLTLRICKMLPDHLTSPI